MKLTNRQKKYDIMQMTIGDPYAIDGLNYDGHKIMFTDLFRMLVRADYNFKFVDVPEMDNFLIFLNEAKQDFLAAPTPRQDIASYIDSMISNFSEHRQEVIEENEMFAAFQKAGARIYTFLP